MPATNFAQARARVIERLRARRAEVDEAIFVRVSDRWFDRSGSEDPEYVAGLRAAGAAALDYVLIGVERLGQSFEPVPVVVLEQARRAARAGVGSETVLRRYLAGYAVLEGFVLQEAEHDELLGRTGALRDVLQRMSALVDRLTAAVGRAHAEELTRPNDIRADRTKPPVGGAPRRLRTSRRDSILRALAVVAAERGLENAPVKLISERAGVSTRTFYELFPAGLDDAVVAVIDMGLERAGVLAWQALAREGSPRDGMRAALAAVLSFFDREPELARMLLVETLKGGPAVLNHRERAVDAFRALVVAQIEKEVARASPLAAEGVLGAVMSVVRARLISDQSRPLIELLGPLMGLIVEHVADRRTAVEEARRGEELAQAIQAGEVPGWVLPPQVPGRDPTTRRLRECLLFLAERGRREPGPSNREVATAIGIGHKSQISKLLSQLRDQGLAVKRSTRPGGPNEWRLTARGEETVRALGEREGQ
jgi:AcrR family transcriptional regulator